MNPAKLAVSTVQPALVSWGKVLTRFRDGAGLAKLVPEWRGVGRLEQDTTEMKTLDDQASAGSNTEDFLELRRVTEVRAKLGPLLTLANLAWRVSALLGEDVPAITLQGAVCKFCKCSLALLVARPLAELEKKIARLGFPQALPFSVSQCSRFSRCLGILVAVWALQNCLLGTVTLFFGVGLSKANPGKPRPHKNLRLSQKTKKRSSGLFYLNCN